MLRLLSFLLVVWCIAADLDPSKSKAPEKLSDETFGIVMLDAFTYPVVVNEHAHHATVVMVFDKAFSADYTTASFKSDYFRLALSFQKEIKNREDDDRILFSQVVVNGASNKKLGQMFGLKKPKKNSAEVALPKFFIVPAGSTEPIPYAGIFERSDFFKFVSLHSKIDVGLPGTLPEFDKLAGRFLTAMLTSVTDGVSTAAEGEVPVPAENAAAQSVLDEAQALLAAQIPESESLEVAEHYVKVMAKIMEKNSFAVIKSEMERLQQVSSRKERAVGKLKQAILRRNVWQSFDYLTPVVTGTSSADQQEKVDNSAVNEF
jgi:hypothetical protein